MGYITRYFPFILLGFVLLRLPHGTPMLGAIFNYAILLGFLLTLQPTIELFPSLKFDAKVVYCILLSMLVFLLLSRYLNGYPFTTDTIVRGFMYPAMFVNLFTVIMTKDLWGKLKAVDFVLTIFLVVNFLTVIIYPDGWFSSKQYELNWFLGYKNVMIRPILPALVISSIISFHKYGQFSPKTILLFALGAVTTILSQSVTSLIMIVVLGISLFFKQILNKIKYFSLLAVFVIPVAIAIGLVIFNIQENFVSFFEKDLGRDTTLTGRTSIWEFVLTKIAASPFIGYGYHSAQEWHDVFFEFQRFNISHPHNFILYSLIQGGIIYVLMYVLLIVIITYYTYQHNDNTGIFLLTIMYFIFFTGGIAESLTECPLMFPMFGLFMTIKNHNIKSGRYEKNRSFYRDRSLQLWH